MNTTQYIALGHDGSIKDFSAVLQDVAPMILREDVSAVHKVSTVEELNAIFGKSPKTSDPVAAKTSEPWAEINAAIDQARASARNVGKMVTDIWGSRKSLMSVLADVRGSGTGMKG